MTKEPTTLERAQRRDRPRSGSSIGRKPYIRPLISAQRPLAAVTLGGSPGTGDSGGGAAFQDPL